MKTVIFLLPTPLPFYINRHHIWTNKKLKVPYKMTLHNDNVCFEDDNFYLYGCAGWHKYILILNSDIHPLQPLPSSPPSHPCIPYPTPGPHLKANNTQTMTFPHFGLNIKCATILLKNLNVLYVYKKVHFFTQKYQFYYVMYHLIT